MSGDSWSEKLFFWFVIGFMVLLFFVIPVVLPIVFLISNPNEANWLFVILGLGIFFMVSTEFFGPWEHKILRFFIYVPVGIVVLVILRLGYLHIRDTFAKDTQSGMAELIGIPVAAVIYGLVIWLLPVGLSESTRKLALAVARVLTILIIAVLVYLIYR